MSSSASNTVSSCRDPCPAPPCGTLLGASHPPLTLNQQGRSTEDVSTGGNGRICRRVTHTPAPRGQYVLPRRESAPEPLGAGAARPCSAVPGSGSCPTHGSPLASEEMRERGGGRHESQALGPLLTEALRGCRLCPLPFTVCVAWAGAAASLASGLFSHVKGLEWTFDFSIE